MSIQGGPDIVENGLILCYDPANIESYVSGSTTMYDLGSTGNTASLVGGVEYTGSFKGIFNFDGLNDYINIARPSSIATSGSFSVCMFAKWRTVGTTTSSIQTLLDNNHNSSPVQGFVIQDRPELSKKLSFSVRPDQLGAVSSFYVGNNNWYHITGTHDGTVSRLYINGVLDGFASQSGGISTVQPDINIGRWQNAGSRYFTGSIGQVLVYNRALSLAEVQQNYNTIKFRYPPSPAYPPDAHFENVTLLLSGEGINGSQNNTFLDSGPNNLTVTSPGGVVTQGTFSPYGDRWSNYFDGTGDYLTVPYTSSFDWYTSGVDFTVEAWVYANAWTTWSTSGGVPRLVGNMNPIGAANNWTFGPDLSGSLAFRYYSPPSIVTVTSSVSLPTSQWNHIAMTKTTSGITLFINGIVASATTAIIGNPTSGTSQPLSIGGYDTTGIFAYAINGYVSNLRIVRGTAVYSGNYTVPISPLTAITNTQLLTCQSNRFRDASSNNFVITRSADVSIQRFSPFSPSAAYDASTMGGSGYFAASNNNRLAVSSDIVDIGTNAFTVESWVYYGGGGIRTWYAPSGPNPFHVNGTTLRVYYDTGFLQAGPVEVNAWTHIAVTRDSSNVLRAFINGVLNSSVTATYSYTNSSPFIGDRAGLGQPFLGYISGFRLLIGTALYTSNFTPPTSPPTAIANTRWLVNFSNAGIIDSSMMNSLQTAGNAQISTSVKKYGNSSLFFDGTGDWLLAPNYPSITLEGDFTIEAWIYVTAGGAHRGIVTIGDRNTSNGLSLFWQSSTAIIAISNGTQIVGTGGVLGLNTWAHIALTRRGTGTNNLKIYFNGVMSGQNGVGNTTIFSGAAANGVCVGVSYASGFIEPFQGYIDDVRITKGVARYTENFTPPAAALPDL